MREQCFSLHHLFYLLFIFSLKKKNYFVVKLQKYFMNFTWLWKITELKGIFMWIVQQTARDSDREQWKQAWLQRYYTSKSRMRYLSVTHKERLGKTGENRPWIILRDSMGMRQPVLKMQLHTVPRKSAQVYCSMLTVQSIALWLLLSAPALSIIQKAHQPH